MRTFKLTLAYDGTAYAGWQVQPGARTVQGAMEEAIGRITGEQLRVAASGRTDAGVHALGQVASFQTASRLSAEVFQKALNAELPRDIAVLAAEEMSPGFHALRDARRKRYRYVIHDGPTPDVFRRGYSWHHRGRLDAAAMHRAAQTLLGTHDFRSFETSGAERATSVRTILDISVRRDKGDDRDFVTLEVEANGFLYNMVRTIAGTLAKVGQGAKPESWPLEVVESRDRRLAGMTAPPQGLFLVRVQYD